MTNFNYPFPLFPETGYFLPTTATSRAIQQLILLHFIVVCSLAPKCSLFVFAEASRVVTGAEKTENSVILFFLSRHSVKNASHHFDRVRLDGGTVCPVGGKFALG